MGARRPKRSTACWPESSGAGLLALVLVLVLAACGGGGAAHDDGDTDVSATSEGDDGEASASATTSAASAGDDDGLPPPDCMAPEVECGQTCADLDTDPNNCGGCGTSCVIPAGAPACMAGACTMSTCDVGFADCDGDVGNGCEHAIDCHDGDACTTACNSTGALGCADPCAPACAAPAESCNALDDDCDGACDQGPLAGCRVGIHRAIGSIGHFYSADLNEVAALGLTVEVENFFWLYADDTGGLVPLFRCAKAGGRKFLTSSIDCETTGAPELTLGFMANPPICGAIELYRSYNATNDDHFYTTSLAEHQNAIAMYGYADQGIAGYVFAGP